MAESIVIATRESRLALWQAEHVRDLDLPDRETVADVGPGGFAAQLHFKAMTPEKPLLLRCDEHGTVGERNESQPHPTLLQSRMNRRHSYPCCTKKGALDARTMNGVQDAFVLQATTAAFRYGGRSAVGPFLYLLDTDYAWFVPFFFTQFACIPTPKKIRQ